jgi:hypothetical protein
MDLRLDDDALDRIDEIVPRNVSRSWYSLRDRAGLDE